MKEITRAKIARACFRTQMKLIKWTERAYEKDRRCIIDFDLIWQKIECERNLEEVEAWIKELEEAEK